MALVRPRPPRYNTAIEPKAELVLVEQVLSELKDVNGKIDGIVKDQELLKVNLLGGVGADTEHGRLPMVETVARDHEKRIKVLEEDKIRWRAYAVAASAIGGFTGGLIGICVNIILAIVKR